MAKRVKPDKPLKRRPAAEAEPAIQQVSVVQADRSSISVRDRLYMKLGEEKQTVHVLSLDDTLLTPAERQLVMLLAEQYMDKSPSPAAVLPEDERFAGMISEWLQDHAVTGQSYELPEPLQVYPSMYNEKVPFLLVGESADDADYREWKKLLETYFESDVILVPLQEKEWLILADNAVLTDGEEEQQSEENAAEQLLTDLALGLHEMVGEWVGESHISVHHPIVPAKTLPAVQLLLREAITLGRTYHMTRNVHLPWKLHMEKLLNGVPAAEKRTFYEQVLRGFEHQMDSEMLGTLELFFEMDCNVSETAKRLYIHRNTLLYRLDKFKQETGLDVRNFSDAMLVKTALLLYKVTKRK
ncbi:PucR family transcriptional regulator [Xylanibacillus composti]|nr:PucR family transcriptional regulator [Xylanibacillus composti]